MVTLKSSMASLFQPKAEIIETRNDSNDSNSPIQQFTIALKAVKEGNLAELEKVLLEFHFSRMQLSQLLIHAANITNYKIAAALVSEGADITFNNHQVWHTALAADNKNLITYLRIQRIQRERVGQNLYIVV